MHSRCIDSSQPWRLSHILEGHTSDVKCVTASTDGADVELLFTASRDETGRSWHRNVDGEIDIFCRAASYQGNRFQNAVVHVRGGDSDVAESAIVLLGGLDAAIRAFNVSATYSERPQRKILQLLDDHFDNVCHLSALATPEHDLLISASWDCTSRVWRKRRGAVEGWQHVHTLKGHERAVWAAEVLEGREGGERYLTASADTLIRLWHGDEVAKVFSGHTDVVRGIALLPVRSQSEDDRNATSSLPPFYADEHLFVTASNDGSQRVWSLDDRRSNPNRPGYGGEALRVLRSSEQSDLLYDVKYVGPSRNDYAARLVVSCGEDGLLRGWNVEDATIAFSIPQPVTSVWSLAILPLSGDIATANSDGKVRIFTQRQRRSDTAGRHVGGPSMIGEVSDNDVQEHKALCTSIQAAKRRSNVEAEVVAQPGSAEAANESEGRVYDAILKIDVSDEGEPLSLPINRGDDARAVARAFIQRYSLPTSYEDQIAAFVEQVGPK